MAFYEKSKLDNGAVAVSEYVPGVRSVTLGFWVGVGSRGEADAENGMSHFVEHLLFKGTKTRSALDISETFDALGAEINAFTTKEFTCYYTRLLDDHLPIGIEVLSDMLQNSTFKSEHINFERQVVLEEIAMYEDTPDELIHDIFTAQLWGKHPLGKQVLGTAETVGKFDSDKIMDFYRRQYTPENIVIAAAGNLKHDRLLKLINRFYSTKPSGKPKRNVCECPASSTVKVINRPTEQVHLCYGTIALNAKHPDRFVMSVLDSVIGGGMSSRLFQKIREERGLAYSVYSYHSLYQDSGNFTIYAGTRPANVNEVMSIIKTEIDLVKQKGITKEELIRAKEHLKGQLVLGLESTKNRMTRLGKSELTQGEILSVDELVERVDKVMTTDIIRLANETFKQEKMILTVIGPIEERNLVV